MEKEFIPYEIALALKELGFDEPCIGFWWNNKDFTEPEFLLEYCEHLMEGNLKRPLYQQAFRWFREKYNLFYDILQYIDKDWKYTTYSDNVDDFSQSGFYNTYEEAELECLKKLISIVKEK